MTCRSTVRLAAIAAATAKSRIECECPSCGDGIFLLIITPPEGKMMITRLHVCPAEEEDSAIDLDDDDDWWSR
jgi:hypothetical protein